MIDTKIKDANPTNQNITDAKKFIKNYVNTLVKNFYDDLYKKVSKFNTDCDNESPLSKKLKVTKQKTSYNNIPYDADTYLEKTERRDFCNDVGIVFNRVSIKKPNKKYPDYFTMQELYKFCLDKNNKPSLYRFLKSKGIHRNKVFKEMLANDDYKLDIYCNIASAFLQRRTANRLSGYTTKSILSSIDNYVIFKHLNDLKIDRYKSKISKHIHTIEKTLLSLEMHNLWCEYIKDAKANQKKVTKKEPIKEMKATKKKANQKNTPDHTQDIQDIQDIQTLKTIKAIKMCLLSYDKVGIKKVA